MTEHDSNAGSPLPQTQITDSSLSSLSKDAFLQRMTTFDEDLINFIEGNRFFQQALLSLCREDAEPDSWIIGALVLQRSLQRAGDQLQTELDSAKLWLGGID